MALPQEIKLNYDDYCSLPEDGKRHEVIDGEHVVSPSPSTRHQQILFKLTLMLGTFVEQNRSGQLFHAPYDVVLSDFDVVQPDLLFVRHERFGIITDKNLQGAPDLAVEILSESTRRTDEVIKRKLYERAGVGEYWIVDPVLDTVKVHRREGEAFVRAAELSLEDDATLESPLFPGLALRLADLFPPR